MKYKMILLYLRVDLCPKKRIHHDFNLFKFVKIIPFCSLVFKTCAIVSYFLHVQMKQTYLSQIVMLKPQNLST